jgi:hypothetical protein
LACSQREEYSRNVGREADLERNTQAQAEHERCIDQVLQQQRQRLLDSEVPRDVDRGQDLDLSTDERPAPITEPDAGRDPYIEQVIQEARDRQESWERVIDPDRDNDRGFGIE